MSILSVLGYLIVSALFGVVILCLWLRIALHYLRVSSLNSLSQLIHRLTNPIVNPLNALFKQNPNLKLEWTCFIVLIGVECLKIACLSLLFFHAILPLPYFLLYVMADLIIVPLDLLFYALLIRVILSFVNPQWKNPIVGFVFLLTEPLLKIGRRLVPIVAGIDLSPFIMILILKTISILLVYSLPWRLL